MRRQHSLRSAAAAAVLIMTICVPAVIAEDEIPYEDPSARIGHPPGLTDETSPVTQTTTIAPSTDDDPPSEVRTVRGVHAGARASLWDTFLSWLEQQALRITGGGRM